MRRGWIVIALVVLVLAAAGAAFLAATRLAPEALRAGVERRLSGWLGAPVAVGGVSLSLDQGLAVELRDVRVAEGPLRGRVDQGVARLDAVALVLGRVSPGSVTLSGADLAWLPPQGAGPSPAGRPAPAASPEAWRKALDGAASRLFGLASLPVRGVELQRARLALVAPGADPSAPSLVLEDLDVRLRRGRLRQRSELRVEARLHVPAAPGAEAGRLALEAGLEPESLDGRLRGSSLALAPLAGAVGALGARVPGGVAGRAGGELRWRASPGGAHRLDASFTVRGAPGLHLARAADPGAPVELALQAELGRAELRVERARLGDGAAALQVAGTLGLPVRDAAPLRLEAELAGVERADLGTLAARLPERARDEVRRALAPVESGRLVLGRVSGERSLAAWREIAAGRHLSELALRLEIEGVRLRVGDGDALEGVAGTLSFDGDALRIEGLRGRRGASPLPRLDGILRGVAQVEGPEELNCVAPATRAALPGARDLVRWLSRPPGEKGPPRWSGVAIEADWIAHPALLCSLEQVAAALRPAEGGLDLELTRGVWAGVPLSGRAAYRTGERGATAGLPSVGAAPDPAAPEAEAAYDRLSLELDMGPPFEAMAPRPPATRWMQGRFEAGPAVLGPWHLAGARGGFRAADATLHLTGVDVSLDPGGRFEARAIVDLSAPGPLPVRVAAQVEGAEILQLAPAVGIDSDALAGSLHGAVSLESHIARGRSFLAGARGVLSLHARDGRIHRRLGLLEALTMAEGGWNPFVSHDQLPYRAIDLVGHVGDGAVVSETLTLDGPTVRMVGSGRLAVAKPHALEVVLGVFPFRGLDGVIGRVPLVNRVLLGSDRSLMGAYYALDGPFAEPRARLIPIKTLAAGPASFVLEDVPGFVWGGLKRIQSVLVPGRDPDVAVPEPPAERADS